MARHLHGHHLLRSGEMGAAMATCCEIPDDSTEETVHRNMRRLYALLAPPDPTVLHGSYTVSGSVHEGIVGRLQCENHGPDHCCVHEVRIFVNDAPCTQASLEAEAMGIGSTAPGPEPEPTPIPASIATALVGLGLGHLL